METKNKTKKTAQKRICKHHHLSEHLPGITQHDILKELTHTQQTHFIIPRYAFQCVFFFVSLMSFHFSSLSLKFLEWEMCVFFHVCTISILRHAHEHTHTHKMEAARSWMDLEQELKSIEINQHRSTQFQYFVLFDFLLTLCRHICISVHL